MLMELIVQQFVRGEVLVLVVNLMFVLIHRNYRLLRSLVYLLLLKSNLLLQKLSLLLLSPNPLLK